MNTCGNEHSVSLFSASMIRQPWCNPMHLPATKCLCGKFYYSWKDHAWFRCDTFKLVKREEVLSLLEKP
jgi:hypothetical protein